jgi:hypothetical protein
MRVPGCPGDAVRSQRGAPTGSGQTHSPFIGARRHVAPLASTTPEHRTCSPLVAPPGARPWNVAPISSAATPWVTMGRTRRADSTGGGAAVAVPHRRTSPAHRVMLSPVVSAGPGVEAGGRGLHDRPGKGAMAMSAPRAIGVWTPASPATVSCFDMSSLSTPDRRPR